MPLEATSKASRASADKEKQAICLITRGDLRKQTFSFEAALMPPRRKAWTKGLGMTTKSLAKTDPLAVSIDGTVAPLQVSSVCKDLSTPAGGWNTREERNANRDPGEKHVSLAIKPGDKILAVNDISEDDAMVDKLAEAANLLSPKPVNLMIRRKLSDVFKPPSTPLSRPSPAARSLAENILGHSRSAPDMHNMHIDSLPLLPKKTVSSGSVDGNSKYSSRCSSRSLSRSQLRWTKKASKGDDMFLIRNGLAALTC